MWLMGKENSSSRLMRAWSVSENGIIWVFQLCKSLVGKGRWTRKGSLGLYSLPAPCSAGRDKPLAMPFLGEQLVSGLHCLEKFQHTLILWRWGRQVKTDSWDCRYMVTFRHSWVLDWLEEAGHVYIFLHRGQNRECRHFIWVFDSLFWQLNRDTCLKHNISAKERALGGGRTYYQS